MKLLLILNIVSQMNKKLIYIFTKLLEGSIFTKIVVTMRMKNKFGLQGDCFRTLNQIALVFIKSNWMH